MRTPNKICKFFLDNCSYKLAKKSFNKVFDSVIILRFGETKLSNEEFYAEKKTIQIWNFNVDNIVVSILIKTKTN